MFRARWPRTLAPALLALLVAACDAPPASPDARAARSDDGSSVQVDSAAADSDGALGGAGGLAGFLAPCSANADCASMLCHYYPGVGSSFCSKPCSTAADCPAPSPGCNGMGVCRIH
jgi:hypothetical protein